MTSEFLIPVHKNQSVSFTVTAPAQKTGTAKDKMLVVMAHDFPGTSAGHGDLFLQLEEALVDDGFTTLRFDFRGCGKSFGKSEQFTMHSAIKDLQAMLRWGFNEGDFDSFIYIGEGLGATVCIENSDLDVKAMVLFWPVLDMAAHHQVIRKGGTFNQDEKLWLWDGHKIGGALMEELAIRRIEHDLRDSFMPVLMFQGAQDPVVSAENVKIAKKHMNSKRLECTIFHQGGRGLNLPAQRAEILKATLEFLNKNT
jgi:pimeloyl-ACP methyl ester carboxylesterase